MRGQAHAAPHPGDSQHLGLVALEGMQHPGSSLWGRTLGWAWVQAAAVWCECTGILQGRVRNAVSV